MKGILPMGKVVWKGWSTSVDQIIQPVSIIFGTMLTSVKAVAKHEKSEQKITRKTKGKSGN
jgi:hypothetical protein